MKFFFIMVARFKGLMLNSFDCKVMSNVILDLRLILIYLVEMEHSPLNLQNRLVILEGLYFREIQTLVRTYYTLYSDKTFSYAT